MLAALVLVAALGLALSRSAERRTGTNGVLSLASIVAPAGTRVCQAGELLPAGTGEVRIAGATTAAPLVVVRDGRRVLARSEARVDLDGGGGEIRAPIRRTERARDGVTVCLTLRGAGVLGRGGTPPGVGTVVVPEGPIAGSSIAISYVSAEQRSWWAFASTLADRLRGGHDPGRRGGLAWAVLGLLVASFALTAWIVLRTLVRDRPPPRIGLAIAAVAVLNAAAWSLITPPFQVPDEVAHVAYVQSLGETGRPLAHPPALAVSPEQATAMADSGFGEVVGRSYRAAGWSQMQDRLTADVAGPLSRRATIAAGEAEPEPPLYYALETIPYRVAHAGGLLDRMELMRLLSALLAGATALLCFRFVRECLPAKPWAWTVGGLGVALAPMLGFVAGGVNPDALVFTLSAALFLCVACAWRRGATMRLALAIGVLIGAGMLTKVNFYALVPGALLGFALAARRTTLAWDRRALTMVGAAALLGAGMLAAGAAFEQLAWQRSLLAARPIAPESHVGLLSHVGYIWQVFLPRLPFQAPTALTNPGYQQLFESFIGAFGQLVVWFPSWVYRLSAAALVLVGLLAVRLLHADPRELRWRRGELLGYAAMAGALLLLIGLSADLRRHLISIVQGRYLLPLLPLFGALLALGARGAGERWGRAVGVAIVSAAVAWSVFGQLQTIAWFYG